MKAGDPARIQLIYERALAENCLVPDLWARYNQYLVRNKTPDVSSFISLCVGFGFVLILVADKQKTKFHFNPVP